ncbi:hypothetical protein Tco_0201400 [Tanacetum coccineum]
MHQTCVSDLDVVWKQMHQTPMVSLNFGHHLLVEVELTQKWQIRVFFSLLTIPSLDPAEGLHHQSASSSSSLSMLSLVSLTLTVTPLYHGILSAVKGFLRAWISYSFLDGGTYGVGEIEFCMSPELMYPGVIKEGAGDTGLGDERSMTEVSVKEQMKKLVG